MAMDPDRVYAIMGAGLRFKKAMIAAGKDRATGKCPFCENGKWTGTLAGPKKHIRVKCDRCTVEMME